MFFAIFAKYFIIIAIYPFFRLLDYIPVNSLYSLYVIIIFISGTTTAYWRADNVVGTERKRNSHLEGNSRDKG